MIMASFTRFSIQINIKTMNFLWIYSVAKTTLTEPSDKNKTADTKKKKKKKKYDCDLHLMYAHFHAASEFCANVVEPPAKSN